MFGIVIKLNQVYYPTQGSRHRFDRLIQVNLKQYILRYIYIFLIKQCCYDFFFNSN
jgi:hypothetical protein